MFDTSPKGGKRRAPNAANTAANTLWRGVEDRPNESLHVPNHIIASILPLTVCTLGDTIERIHLKTETMGNRLKYIFATIGISLVCTALAALLFVYSGIDDVAADKNHSGFKRWLFSTVKNMSTSSQSSDLKIPNLSERKLVLEGIVAYEDSCSGCHGTPGKKPGPISTALSPPAPWLGGVTEPLSKGVLKRSFWATKYGIEMTGMPGWSKRKRDSEIWAIMAALRKFPSLDRASYMELLEEGKRDSE